MDTNQKNERSPNRPNILNLCMDQWDTHMWLPDDMHFPAMERLEAQGVSFDHQYCSVPICTPSRATMWTGVHASHTGAYENTNFAWIEGLSHDNRPSAIYCASRATTPRAGSTVRSNSQYTAGPYGAGDSSVSRLGAPPSHAQTG